MGSDRYKAEIGHDIMAQKDLPDTGREHLLPALDTPNDDELEFDFPAVYMTPDGRVIWEFGNSNGAF